MKEKFHYFDLLYFSFFLVFINILPIDVETQPLFTLAISILYTLTHLKKSFLFTKKDILFLYFLVLTLFIYTLFQVFFKLDLYSIVELLKYLIGPLIYLGLRTMNLSLKLRTLSLIVYLLLSLAILNILFPSVYSSIFQFLIPRFSSNQIGGTRGITILTPEPSYFSVFEIILLITVERALVQPDITQNYISKLNFLKYIVILIAFFTKSALVIAISLIFLIPDLTKLRFKKMSIYLFLFIPLSFFIFYYGFLNNRLFEITSGIYGLVNEGDFNLLTFLFSQESSGGTRMIVNFLAISSIFYNPIGSGIGSFPTMIQNHAFKFDLDLSRHEVLGAYDLNRIYPQTYFANLCNDIGLFALLLIPVITINNTISSKNFILKKNLCLLILLFFQSQITSPAFWYLIALSKLKSDEKIIK